jgi:hypothetical protein
MSSPLSGARCVRVEPGEAWIRLEPEQALTLPYSEIFALALALEPLHTATYAGPGRPWPKSVAGPIAAVLAAEMGGDPSDALMGGWPRDRALAFARGWVEHRGYRDADGFLLPPRLSPDPDGLYPPSPWWRDDAEREGGSRALGRAFEEWTYAQSRFRHDRAPAPPGPRPAITLVVAALRPGCFAHLRSGMIWDSYVFDDDAPRHFP